MISGRVYIYIYTHICIYGFTHRNEYRVCEEFKKIYKAGGAAYIYIYIYMHIYIYMVLRIVMNIVFARSSRKSIRQAGQHSMVQLLWIQFLMF